MLKYKFLQTSILIVAIALIYTNSPARSLDFKLEGVEDSEWSQQPKVRQSFRVTWNSGQHLPTKRTFAVDLTKEATMSFTPVVEEDITVTKSLECWGSTYPNSGWTFEIWNPTKDKFEQTTISIKGVLSNYKDRSKPMAEVWEGITVTWTATLSEDKKTIKSLTPTFSWYQLSSGSTTR